MNQTPAKVVILAEPVVMQVIDYIETHVNRPMKEVKLVVGALYNAERLDAETIATLRNLASSPEGATPNGSADGAEEHSG